MFMLSKAMLKQAIKITKSVQQGIQHEMLYRNIQHRGKKPVKAKSSIENKNSGDCNHSFSRLFYGCLIFQFHTGTGHRF